MAPRQIPRPTRRKGAKTWEIRMRVRGKITTRTLGTRNFKEALERSPEVWKAMLEEPQTPTESVISANSNESPLKKPLDVLPLSDVSHRYRTYLLDGHLHERKELAAAGVLEPNHLASKFRSELQRRLVNTQNRALVYNFDHQDWYLNFLESTGAGIVKNRNEAREELSRVAVSTMKEMVARDKAILDGTRWSEAKLTPGNVTSLAESAVPTLTGLLEDYIRECGDRMSSERAAEHRSTVRDFCEVAGEKLIDEYRKEDVRKFKNVLMSLPPNWRKKKETRDYDICRAAEEAKKLNLSPQKAKTIQMKRNHLSSIFSYAEENYYDVEKLFNVPWKVSDAAAANKKDAFKQTELDRLFQSTLKGHLHWLTWLALFTGARCNELCQLTIKHINFSPVPHIYFSPDLRLKTTHSGGSSVRSVPIHNRLIDEGFMDYVKNIEVAGGSELFVGLPVHRSGKLSDSVSKAFTRHLKKLDLKRDGLSFHSLRHTFGAKFKLHAPLETETRERLMGHAVAGVAGRYGNCYETEARDFDLIRARAKILNKIDFGL